MEKSRFIKADDTFLAPYDIMGSKAHVNMLKSRRIISRETADKILKALDKLNDSIKKNKFKNSGEDIHYSVEKEIIKMAGETGGSMHTARSRNDQVALDMRLYLKNRISDSISRIDSLQNALIRCAEKNMDAIMPGYTHLQPGQPMLFSHHILAYAWMLQRDKERLKDSLKRNNMCPLGSAAFAGTSFNIDRRHTAKNLGFDGIIPNSADAVSDRDFIIEFISCSAMIMMHLSRLCEELIIWSCPQFNFVTMPDKYVTGSSIMPQKKNPDFAELVRAKSGKIYGNLINMLVVMKGLPMAYNRDMQEDKSPLKDTVETVADSLDVCSGIIGNMKINSREMRNACDKGYILATELADLIASKGVPFRKAHSMTAQIVEYCRQKNTVLSDLQDEEYKKYIPGISVSSIKSVLDLKNSINRRISEGSTSFKEVRAQIKKLKRIIK